LPSTNHAGKPRHKRWNSWEDTPGIPTIDCKIQNIPVKVALCDLGASVNIMPMTFYKRIDWVLPLPQTDIQVQLADSTIQKSKGKLYHIPVWIRQQVIFTDFIILDTEGSLDMPLILGRPFLRSAKAQINIWVETIRFNINAQKMLFGFQPHDTPCIIGYNLPLSRNQRKHQDRKLNEYVSPTIQVTGRKSDGWKDKWGTPTIQCSILNISVKELFVI
jgi:hypothetical protein